MKISTKLFTQLEHYLRLETVDMLSVATYYIVVVLVVFALGTSVVFFLSMALVQALSVWIGNETMAYLVVGLSLLLIILIFWFNKKTWVQNKLVRKISASVLSEPMITGDESELDIDDDDYLNGGEAL